MTRPLDTLAIRRLIGNLSHLLTGADDDHQAACAVQCVMVGHSLQASMPKRNRIGRPRMDAEPSTVATEGGKGES